jgi:hypothetical protein
MDYQLSWIIINYGLAAEHSRQPEGFNQGTCHLDQDVKLAAQVCRLLAPMPSTVEPLLVEDGQIEYFALNTDRKVWHDLVLGAAVFDNFKTLPVARRFVGAPKRSSLQLDDEG